MILYPKLLWLIHIYITKNCLFLSWSCKLSSYAFSSHSFSQFTKVISVMTVSLIIIYYDAWLEEYEIGQHDFNAYDGNITRIRYRNEKEKGVTQCKRTQQNDHHLTVFQLSWLMTLHAIQLKAHFLLDGMRCVKCGKYVSEVGRKNWCWGNKFSSIFHGLFHSHICFLLFRIWCAGD